jgi:outer membrane protease
MGKLDEIAMFMADFKDIREEFSRDTAAQMLYRQKGWTTLTSTSGTDRDHASKNNSEPVTARSAFTSKISY